MTLACITVCSLAWLAFAAMVTRILADGWDWEIFAWCVPFWPLLAAVLLTMYRGED